MKFTVTIDKKAEAVIDRKLCINCGECRRICPTGAVSEYQRTAFCMQAPGACGFEKKHPEVKRQAVENACSAGCPLGIVPQTISALIKHGELDEAAKHIRERNPLPYIGAAVCEQFCGERCQRAAFGEESIDMKGLEAFVLTNTETKPFKHIRKYREKMAVIGGGPAGLSAAFHLSKAGYPVTIFEKDNALGGAVNWGIPSFRINKELMKEEIERLISVGIDVRYGWHIGKDKKLDELWEEGFSACLIAVGDSYGLMPDIKGCDADGVYDGVTVMRRINGEYKENVYVGDKAAVVGNDGFAVDLARLLRRTGKEVLWVSDEIKEDLDVSDDMLATLEEEGIDLRTATTVEQIITENGKVKAVELVRENATNYFCDTVIFALGQKCEADNICNAQTYPDGKLRIDDHYRTNKAMVFACGDATGETASVVEAIAAGKAAAEEMHKAVKGSYDLPEGNQVFNAPDRLDIYGENVEHGLPMHPKMIAEASVEPVEDIKAAVRAAGIGEETERFDFDEDAVKVAVIGGGLAGITAALSLARKGYAPTIFEKETELGGAYRWLATERRLDKTVLKHELKKIEASGIHVIYGATGGINPNISQLQRMGYEAILFAIGEYGGDRHSIEGRELYGVFDMATLMGRLTDNEDIRGIGNKVLISGGDEMTFDMAMKLKEICDEVTVLSPWSRRSLEAKTGAVEAALKEGANLVTGIEIIKVEGECGMVCNAVCKVTEKGYTINVPCDTLILGGGGPATDTIAMRNLRLDINEDGRIVTDKNLATSIKSVFAIGDMDMSAADAGRVGAAAVDNYLSGKEGYLSLGEKKKMPVDHEIVQGNINVGNESFDQYEIHKKSFNERTAQLEASRCMGCGYHESKKDMCMGCGVCVRVCPVNAVSMVPVVDGTEKTESVEV